MAREHLAAELNNLPRKSLVMRGETNRKPLAEDLKRAIGQAIERAIAAAHLEKQDVAYRMGYSDQSALGRWIAGVETPQFAKLFLVPELRAPLVVALAQLAEDAEIVTTIRIRRSA